MGENSCRVNKALLPQKAVSLEMEMESGRWLTPARREPGLGLWWGTVTPQSAVGCSQGTHKGTAASECSQRCSTAAFLAPSWQLFWPRGLRGFMLCWFGDLCYSPCWVIFKQDQFPELIHWPAPV